MLMRRDDFSISQIAEQLDEIRILSEGKLDSEYVKLSRTQGLAIYYTTVINQATAALISIRKVDTTSQETVCEKIARCTEAVRQLLIVSLKTQNALIRTAVNWAIARQSETHKSMLSKAGKRGASVKHQRVQALKQWALGEAETMRGSDMERARKLSARIPPQFADASIEPKRLIYDAIRGSK